MASKILSLCLQVVPWACCLLVVLYIVNICVTFNATTTSNALGSESKFSEASDVNNTVYSRRLAVVRPFCEKDAFELVASFGIWDELSPCKEKPEIPIDLVISFSQNLEKSSIGREAVRTIEQVFHQKQQWNKCFDKFIALDTNIDPTHDLYSPKEQGKTLNWVNGPNRQFERTVRAISDSEYELMYLMEADSVPIKRNWLEAFILEIDQMRPFAILGSRYKGDKWDPFFNKLPSSLIHHTNGNAIYNITHPFFHKVLRELESEAKTSANAVAFDLRIQQIIQEGIIGVSSISATFQGTEPLSYKTALFQEWTDQYPPEEIVKESLLNGNYAATNIVQEHINEDVFVAHGANIYKSWNTTIHGGITLVVSDWEEGNSHQLLSTLDDSNHPFSKVLIMQPAGTPPKRIDTVIPANIQYRGGNPDFMDFCTARVTTEWFMLTSSYFRLRPNVTVMVNQKDNGLFKPVVSTVDADEETCFSHPSCVEDLNLARYFLPRMNNIFQSDNMIFKTSIRNRFCEKLDLLPDRFSLLSTPATAYMAFLDIEGDGIRAVYTLSDRRKAGSRFAFVPIHEDMLPPTMAKQHRRNRQLQGTGSNATGCTPLATETECLGNGCIWQAAFASCTDVPLSNDAVTTSDSETVEDISNDIAAIPDLPGFSADFSDANDIMANATTFNSLFGNTSTFTSIFGNTSNFMSLLGLPSVSRGQSNSSQTGTAVKSNATGTQSTQSTQSNVSSTGAQASAMTCSVHVIVGGMDVRIVQIPC